MHRSIAISQISTFKILKVILENQTAQLIIDDGKSNRQTTQFSTESSDIMGHLGEDLLFDYCKTLSLLNNHLADTNKTEHNYSQEQHKKPKQPSKRTTPCPKKTCDYIFYNNFNNKCPITIIYCIVSNKSMSHRKMVSFPTSPI